MRSRSSCSIVCLIAALVLISAAPEQMHAQVRIRVPRPRPRQNPPIAPNTSTPTIPTETTSPEDVRENARQPPPPATSQERAGDYVDDGFTWFEAISTQELVKNSPVSTGWALKSDIRLVGSYPRQSAIKVTVLRAGKTLATTRCEMFQYAQEARTPSVPPHLVTINCQNKTATVKELGKFDVQVVLINGDTDAESVVRNYKIEVQKVDRVRGQVTNPLPDAEHYYVSRHAEAPVSILFARAESVYPYSGEDDRAKKIGSNTVEIYFSLSPGKEGQDARGGYLRCTVDGQPLEMRNDKAEMNVERYYAEVYTDRLAPKFKSGTEYQDEIRFSWIRLVTPFTFGRAADGYLTSLSNHPGKWECALMNNGATWRTWRWTIGADGMPLKHPEQNGNVNLYPTAYLVDTEIPAGGAAIDKRLAPVSATEGFFYGQRWTTPEGKAMAARVPTKGSPAPVPSNRIK